MTLRPFTAPRAPLLVPLSPAGRDTAPRPAERHGATWTPDRLEALQQGIADGLSCARIAQLIGVSRNAVIGKINRLGLATGRAPLVTVQRTFAGRPVRTTAPVDREPRVRTRSDTQREILRVVRREPAAAPTEMSPFACTFADLAPSQCRWPMGDGPALTFCGRARLGSLSYCAGHAQLAYRPTTARAG